MNTLQIILIMFMIYVVIPVVWYYHIEEPTKKRKK